MSAAAGRRGLRRDGVDRSTGMEEQIFALRNEAATNKQSSWQFMQSIYE